MSKQTDGQLTDKPDDKHPFHKKQQQAVSVSEEKRRATSLKVKPSLWKEAKIEAIRNDMQLSEVLEEAIENWIKSRRVPNKHSGDEKHG